MVVCSKAFMARANYVYIRLLCCMAAASCTLRFRRAVLMEVIKIDGFLPGAPHYIIYEKIRELIASPTMCEVSDSSERTVEESESEWSLHQVPI